MALNASQISALDSIKNCKNTFITGFPGSGKSYLIESVCKYFKESKINYGLTALTGCAAILIGGRTLHSFLGIGLAKGTPVELYKLIRRREGLLPKLIALKTLIIDEASMLSDQLFDKICELFKLIHGNNKAFGGIQIILVGDMSQLKPVEGDYCFHAGNWDFSGIQILNLTENMRVQNDPEFEKLLKHIRWGVCTETDFNILESMKNTVFPDYIYPTKLFSTNKDVDSINQFELGKLIQSGAQTINYPIRYTDNPYKLKRSTEYVISNKIPEFTKICVGAQIMITRNLDFDNGIVNGTKGVVVSLNSTSVVIKLVNGKGYSLSYFNHIDPENKIDFKYLPIVLAWAMTIHKSQGMTIDSLEIDLGSSIFTDGQAYVALSRARNKESVLISKLKKSSIKTNKSVIEFYHRK